MNYYISDLHFNHKNILKFDNRPWNNVEDMDKAMIFNWNETVNEDDTVYILGDFVWKTGKVADYCKQLKGHKILILGNHDSLTGPDKRFFDGIYDYLEIKDNGFTVIMSHYPMLSYNKDYLDTSVHLFGHVHNNTKES